MVLYFSRWGWGVCVYIYIYVCYLEEFFGETQVDLLLVMLELFSFYIYIYIYIYRCVWNVANIDFYVFTNSMYTVVQKYIHVTFFKMSIYSYTFYQPCHLGTQDLYWKLHLCSDSWVFFFFFFCCILKCLLDF